MPPLWRVYLAILVITTAEGGMNTILPPYLDRAQYSVELIGVVTALFAFLSLASRLPVGAMYSGARARQLLVAFSTLYIIGTSGFGIGTNALYILPFTLVHGFAFGAITTIMLPVAIQLRSREDSHGARMGWYTAALSAGYALGSFLSGALADRFGFSLTFIGMGLFPLVTIVLSISLPEIVAPQQISPQSKASEGGMRGILATIPSLSPGLVFATLVAFYINFLDDGFGTFFPLFGLGIGLSLTTIGNLKGIKSAIGIIVRAFSGKFFKLVDYRLLNHVLVIAWSLVVFSLPWIREPWIFVALFLFMGFARSLSRVTSATIVAEETAHDHSGIGVASGVYNMGLDVGSLAGPLVAGFVARLTDIPTMMRIIPMMMVTIYFGALLWMNRALRVVRVAEAEGE